MRAPDALEARADAVDDGDVAADLGDLPDELREELVDRRFLLRRMHLDDAEIARARRRLPARVDRHGPRVRGHLQRPRANRAAADGRACRARHRSHEHDDPSHVERIEEWMASDPPTARYLAWRASAMYAISGKIGLGLNRAHIAGAPTARE